MTLPGDIQRAWGPLLDWVDFRRRGGDEPDVLTERETPTGEDGLPLVGRPDLVAIVESWNEDGDVGAPGVISRRA